MRQIPEQPAELLDFSTRKRCEHLVDVPCVPWNRGGDPATAFGGQSQTRGPAIRLVRLAWHETIPLETFHDPGEVAGRDQQVPAQFDERHPLRPAMQLRHDIELRKREAGLNAAPRLGQNQVIRLDQPDPHAQTGALFHGSTAVASISTNARGSNSDFTSSTAMTGKCFPMRG